MPDKMARRTLLKSTLSGGAVLLAGGLAARGAAGAGAGPGLTREQETLQRYAGEFGGSGKPRLVHRRAAHGRI
jgi:hypothetical protein